VVRRVSRLKSAVEFVAVRPGPLVSLFGQVAGSEHVRRDCRAGEIVFGRCGGLSLSTAHRNLARDESCPVLAADKTRTGRDDVYRGGRRTDLAAGGFQSRPRATGMPFTDEDEGNGTALTKSQASAS